jgi:hypothetical protein
MSHPPPWQGPPPYPPPQQSWPPLQQPWRSPPKKGLNTGLVVALAIVGVVVLMVFAAVVVWVAKTPGLGGPVSDARRASNTRTAQSISDFSAVCKDGSIDNSAPYRKPYKIASFNEGEGLFGKSWDHISPKSKAEYNADEANFTTTNVVACLSRKHGSENMVKKCDYDSGGQNVTVDYYAVDYDIELREARTGKLIERLGTVGGPAVDCPFLATYSSKERKIYGNPDGAALQAKLAQFVASS